MWPPRSRSLPTANPPRPSKGVDPRWIAPPRSATTRWQRGWDMDAEIDDGSGWASLSGLGELLVDDGSGEFTVTDGSGSMDIRDVGESLMVREMGSGTLRVSGVEGDFTVRDGRNERIRYSGIAGSVDIPEPRRRGRRRLSSLTDSRRRTLSPARRTPAPRMAGPPARASPSPAIRPPRSCSACWSSTVCSPARSS